MHAQADKDVRHEDKKGNDNENKQTLIVVVSGTPVPVEVNVNAPLHTIIPKALKDHPGQPPENWELKDVQGNLLDLDKKIKDYNFPSDVRLFLSLKAGIGG
jgi:hypothetical protein